MPNLIALVLSPINITAGNASSKMGVEIVEVFRFRGVDIARDVEVEIVGWAGNFRYGNHARIARQLRLLVEHIHDLVNVLRAEPVLVTVLDEACAAINHEDASTRVGVLLVNNDDAGGNSRAIKQVWRQADDAFNQAVFDEILADLTFLVAAEQHAMREDTPETRVCFTSRHFGYRQANI